MLKNMKLSTDVTMMIEMYKLHKTEKEEIEHINKEVIDADKQDVNMRRHFDPTSDRIGVYENNAYKQITDKNINEQVSKSLNKITCHGFILPTDRVREFNGNTLNDSAQQKYLYVYVIIDDEEQTCHMIDNSLGTKIMTVTEFEHDDTEKLLRNILRRHEDNDIPDSNVVKKLRQLWLYQIEDKLPPVDIFEINNKHVKNIIQTVEKDLKNTNHDVPHVSYKQLFEFFDEVANAYITQKTNKVQQWISYESLDSVLKMIISHNNFEHIQDKFDLCPKEDFEEVKHQMLKDREFKNKYQIQNVYKYNDEKPLKPNYERIKGIHGTQNQSILSILLNGLQTNDELDGNKIEHQYTGSGLGRGIYFARPHQVSKSANYTGHSHSQKNYLVYADIDYDRNNAKTISSYDGGSDAHKYSVVIGNRVGVSKGFDEILVPRSENINIRYIVEVERKQH